jgi:hypothetical protein
VPSSAAVERFFSQGKNILKMKRASLAEKTDMADKATNITFWLLTNEFCDRYSNLTRTIFFYTVINGNEVNVTFFLTVYCVNEVTVKNSLGLFNVYDLTINI